MNAYNIITEFAPHLAIGEHLDIHLPNATNLVISRINTGYYRTVLLTNAAVSNVPRVTPHMPIGAIVAAAYTYQNNESWRGWTTDRDGVEIDQNERLVTGLHTAYDAVAA